MKTSVIGAIFVAVVVTNEYGVDGFSVRPTSHVSSSSVVVARPTAMRPTKTTLRYSYESTESSATAFLNSLSRVTNDAAFVSWAESAIEENPEVVQPVMYSVANMFEEAVGDDTMDALERAMMSLKTASASLSHVMEQSQLVFLEAAEESSERLARILDDMPELAAAATSAAGAAAVVAQQPLAMETVTAAASTDHVNAAVSDSLDASTTSTTVAQSSVAPVQDIPAAPVETFQVAQATTTSTAESVDLSSVMAQVDQQAKESVNSVRLADPVSQLNVMENNNGGAAAPQLAQEPAMKAATDAAVSQVNVAAESVAAEVPKKVMDAVVADSPLAASKAAVNQINVATESVVSKQQQPQVLQAAVESPVQEAVVNQVNVVAAEAVPSPMDEAVKQVNVAVEAVKDVPKQQVVEASSQVNVVAESAAANIQQTVMMESVASKSMEAVNLAEAAPVVQQQVVVDAVKDAAPQVLKAVAESTTDAVASSAPKLSDLASQLSDLSYGAAFNNEAVTKPVAKAMAFQSSSPSAPSLSSSFQFSEVFANLGNSFEGVKAALSNSGAASESALFKLNAAASAAPSKVGPLLENAVVQTQAKVTETLVSTSSAVVEQTGTLSLSKLAGAIAGGIQGIGYIIKTLLNVIIEAFTDGGETLDKVILNAERSVNGIVDGAIQSVQNVLDGLSHMTLAEAATNLVTLVVFITKVLFKILNAVIEIATGKGLGTWGSDAAHAIQVSAAELTDAAAAAATDFSTKSFAELTTLTSSFLDQVGQGMVSGATTAWQVAESTNMISNSF